MRRKSWTQKEPAEKVIKDIRRATRKQYSAEEKIRIVLEGLRGEESHLPAKRTLDKLGIPRSTFNRWYDRFLTGGVDALEDCKPQPRRVWNRIPDEVRQKVVDLALDQRGDDGPVFCASIMPAKSAFFRLSAVGRIRPLNRIVVKLNATIDQEQLELVTVFCDAAQCFAEGAFAETRAR